jgi:hypothetical protein
VWTVRTVAAILANPRYTGRQVWNRQRTDHHEIVPGNKRTSTGKTRAWNPRSEWIVSARPAHPALVSEVDFRAAQNINAAATPHDDGARNYALTGLLLCEICRRRLQPHWVHGHPGYRCRHGRTSAHQPGGHPRWVYWPEHRIVTEILAQFTKTGLLPADAGMRELAAYLSDRDAVILCAAATLTVEDPPNQPPLLRRHAHGRRPRRRPRSPSGQSCRRSNHATPCPLPTIRNHTATTVMDRPANQKLGAQREAIQKTPPPPSRKRE